MYGFTIYGTKGSGDLWCGQNTRLVFSNRAKRAVRENVKEFTMAGGFCAELVVQCINTSLLKGIS